MPHPWRSNIRNDVVGGSVSAAAAIPLAMGYGMFALVSLGDEYFANGALAGLYSAFFAALVSIFLGDKMPTVYAPRINSTFSLGASLYGLVHSGTAVLRAHSNWTDPGHLLFCHSFRRIFSGAIRTNQGKNLTQIHASPGHGRFPDDGRGAPVPRTVGQRKRFRGDQAIHL